MQLQGYGVHPLCAFVVALAAVTFLTGCAGPTAETRDEANRATDRLTAIVADVAALAPRIDSACPKGTDTPICTEIRGTWRSVQNAVEVANAAISAYDATGLELERVLSAIDHVADVVHRLRGIVERLQ